MIDLREYQADAIDRVRQALRSHWRVLLQLPTGGGKTAMAAKMAGSARSKGLRVWFTCHRDFLVHQTAGAFETEGLTFSYVAAGKPFNPYAKIHVCAIDTLRRRLGKLEMPHLIICDEAHHAPAKTWEKVLTWASESRLIGLSATPARLDGKGLDHLFDDLVSGPTVGELIDWGYLSDYKAYAPSTPDLKGVHTRAGEFARDEIAHIMEDGQIIGDMVRHYRENCNGARALYFCVSIGHSIKVAATFNAAGIPAARLDGTTSTGERIVAARAFARGDLRVLCNVDLFGEGYDLSAQAGMDVAIDAVGLARPTKSLTLHLQQIGRALRTGPGKPYAIILDHAGNLARHGLPDDERRWTLAGVEKPDKDHGAPVRQCPQCYFVHGAALARCPECGHDYGAAITEGRGVEEIDGELREIERQERRREELREQGQARSVEELTDLARRRGYKNPEKWASYIWTARARKAEDKAQRRAESQAQAYMDI